MKYLLDTNICIYFFKGNFNLKDKFLEVGFDQCAISEISLAELMFGAENSDNPQKNRLIVNHFIENLMILPILDAIPLYAREKVNLRKQGMMISDFDLLIGCTALANNLIMVTENTREFKRIKKLKIENWIKR